MDVDAPAIRTIANKSNVGAVKRGLRGNTLRDTKSSIIDDTSLNLDL
jgi:hypothetical protein